VVLIAILRVSGKRTLSKLNAFDLVITVARGSTLTTVIGPLIDVMPRSRSVRDGTCCFAAWRARNPISSMRFHPSTSRRTYTRSTMSTGQ
jgi:hypothetical protein